jgi:hypothetical protein
MGRDIFWSDGGQLISQSAKNLCALLLSGNNCRKNIPANDKSHKNVEIKGKPKSKFSGPKWERAVIQEW